MRANAANPLYEPSRQVILATYGPPAVLSEELGGIAGSDHLYLFGSWATRYLGEPGRAPNDIDVLVVGSPEPTEVYDAAERAERRIGLPVQATVRARQQWEDGADPFISEVRSRPLVSLLDEAGA